MKNGIIHITIFAILAVFLFSSCSNSKSRADNLSDEMYEYGCAFSEIVNDYLSSTITGEQAEDRMRRNLTLQEAHYEYEKDENNNEALAGTDYSYDYLVYSYSYLTYNAICDKESGIGTITKVEEYYNELKDILWK